jgi:hypothetical protein
MTFKLKTILPSQTPPPPPGCQSSSIHPSPIPSKSDPRAFYLAKIKSGDVIVPPPLISSSEFVPRKLVELLMRRKKDTALGVKFSRSFGSKGGWDEITNMEGAMHTFVTPVVGRCEMVGDYRFDVTAGGHGVHLFGDVDVGNGEGKGKGKGKGKVVLTRSVVLSASIQMDFENRDVMLKVCRLEETEVVGVGLGKDGGWILRTEDKQDEGKRREYDRLLRRYLVFHLTRDGRLPARKEVQNPMDVGTTIQFLEGVIMGREDVGEKLVGKYAELYNNQIVSLELLFYVALHQARNEFSALEALCPQGYVYTYDPASIFAREIGAQILNRLMLLALRYLSEHNNFGNMKIFAFNSYADRGIVALTAKALEKQDVSVVRKADLFRGAGGRYDIGCFAGAKGAMLVVHNNSDGFGQNIEIEGAFGSLDGAIGSYSSAAASLERRRKDLLDFVC